MRAIALAALLAAVSLGNAGAFSLDLADVGLIGASVKRAAAVSVPVAGFGKVSFWMAAGDLTSAATVWSGETSETARSESSEVNFADSPDCDLAFGFASEIWWSGGASVPISPARFVPTFAAVDRLGPTLIHSH